MGQKVHPLGYRVGITQQHYARWFANPDQYAQYVLEDFLLRQSLTTAFPPENLPRSFEDLGETRVVHVKIERFLRNTIKIKIYAVNPFFLTSFKKNNAGDAFQKKTSNYSRTNQVRQSTKFTKNKQIGKGREKTSSLSSKFSGDRSSRKLMEQNRPKKMDIVFKYDQIILKKRKELQKAKLQAIFCKLKAPFLLNLTSQKKNVSSQNKFFANKQVFKVKKNNLNPLLNYCTDLVSTKAVNKSFVAEKKNRKKDATPLVKFKNLWEWGLIGINLSSHPVYTESQKFLNLNSFLILKTLIKDLEVFQFGLKTLISSCLKSTSFPSGMVEKVNKFQENVFSSNFLTKLLKLYSTSKKKVKNKASKNSKAALTKKTVGGKRPYNLKKNPQWLKTFWVKNSQGLLIRLKLKLLIIERLVSYLNLQYFGPYAINIPVGEGSGTGNQHNTFQHTTNKKSVLQIKNYQTIFSNKSNSLNKIISLSPFYNLYENLIESLFLSFHSMNFAVLPTKILKNVPKGNKISETLLNTLKPQKTQKTQKKIKTKSKNKSKSLIKTKEFLNTTSGVQAPFSSKFLNIRSGVFVPCSNIKIQNNLETTISSSYFNFHLKKKSKPRSAIKAEKQKICLNLFENLLKKAEFISNFSSLFLNLSNKSGAPTPLQSFNKLSDLSISLKITQLLSLIQNYKKKTLFSDLISHNILLLSKKYLKKKSKTFLSKSSSIANSSQTSFLTGTVKKSFKKSKKEVGQGTHSNLQPRSSFGCAQDSAQPLETNYFTTNDFLNVTIGNEIFQNSLNINKKYLKILSYQKNIYAIKSKYFKYLNLQVVKSGDPAVLSLEKLKKISFFSNFSNNFSYLDFSFWNLILKNYKMNHLIIEMIRWWVILYNSSSHLLGTNKNQQTTTMSQKINIFYILTLTKITNLLLNTNSLNFSVLRHNKNFKTYSNVFNPNSCFELLQMSKRKKKLKKKVSQRSRSFLKGGASLFFKRDSYFLYINQLLFLWEPLQLPHCGAPTPHPCEIATPHYGAPTPQSFKKQSFKKQGVLNDSGSGSPQYNNTKKPEVGQEHHSSLDKKNRLINRISELTTRLKQLNRYLNKIIPLKSDTKTGRLEKILIYVNKNIIKYKLIKQLLQLKIEYINFFTNLEFQELDVISIKEEYNKKRLSYILQNLRNLNLKTKEGAQGIPSSVLGGLVESPALDKLQGIKRKFLKPFIVDFNTKITLKAQEKVFLKKSSLLKTLSQKLKTNYYQNIVNTNARRRLVNQMLSKYGGRHFQKSPLVKEKIPALLIQRLFKYFYSQNLNNNFLNSLVRLDVNKNMGATSLQKEGFFKYSRREGQNLIHFNSVLNYNLLNKQIYKAENILKLCENLAKIKMLPKVSSIQFISVRTPKQYAICLANFIVEKLEKRFSFRGTMKKAIELLKPNKKRFSKYIKGVKIQIAGRLNGAEIARTEWIREGQVPLQTLKANIDYSYKTANTIYGILGVKVWIFKDI
uniref:Small ribosomal subunit protein uS3c n=1 Tax=Koshicola spirodelophila TaxID=1707787 RepID=A0A160E7N5_9CHLO|nr:ribosomal protein S3 [Koshicola spirodelophila]